MVWVGLGLCGFAWSGLIWVVGWSGYVWRHGDDGVLIGVDFSLCGLIGVGWSDVDFSLILGGDRVGSDGVLIGVFGDRFLI